MAATKQPSIFFLLALIALISSIFNSSNATECVGNGAISVYWGQESSNSLDSEGTLKEACDSGNYNIVILKGLTVFDDGSDPVLNLADHCDTICKELQSQIEHCQKEKHIKVFLSIMKDTKTPISNTASSSSSSAEDEDVAKKLADYLYINYLSGTDGPLGEVFLDGIDLGDVPDSAHLKWDKLVTNIHKFSTPTKKIYLSASPQCVYPDQLLNAAIQTGFIDYIWVEFYLPDPDCIYSGGDATKLVTAWHTWTSKVPKSLIFLGLAASKTATGYIPPDDLKKDVLPKIKTAPNYGGVMISSRYYDKDSGYSGKIKDSVPKVCKCVCDDEPAPTSFSI